MSLPDCMIHRFFVETKLWWTVAALYFMFDTVEFAWTISAAVLIVDGCFYDSLRMICNIVSEVSQFLLSVPGNFLQDDLFTVPHSSWDTMTSRSTSWGTTVPLHDTQHWSDTVWFHLYRSTPCRELTNMQVYLKHNLVKVLRNSSTWSSGSKMLKHFHFHSCIVCRRSSGLCRSSQCWPGQDHVCSIYTQTLRLRQRVYREYYLKNIKTRFHSHLKW